MKKQKSANKTTSNQIAERLLQVYLREYDALRGEYVSILDFQNRLLNYSIIIIGAGLTLNNEFSPVFLLVAALLLAAILWGLMETYFRNRGIGECIQFELKPKIEVLVSRRSDDFPEIFVRYKTGDFSSFSFVMQNIFSSGKFAIALIPCLAFLAAFYFQVPTSDWDGLEKVLFWLVVIVLAIIPIISMISFVRLRKLRENTKSASE